MARTHNFGIIGENGKAIEGVTLTCFSDKDMELSANFLTRKNIGNPEEAPTPEAVEKTLNGMMMSHARSICEEGTLVFPQN